MEYHIFADLRRAGTLIRWFGLDNKEGVIAIIQEAAEDERVTELLHAICLVYEAVIDVLMTKHGIYSISTEINAYARQHEDPDVRRAATWICAIAAKDVDTLNRVLDEAKYPESRITQLVMSVVGVHALLVPAAHTGYGLKRLEAIIKRMLLRENGIDPDEPAA